MGEINRAPQKAAQVVDRCFGELEMIPRCLDDIGETLAMLTCFTHEFEDQEIKKTQGPQTLKILRHLPRLSLLKNRRA